MMLASCRNAAARPLLERLRFYETLQQVPPTEVAPLFARLVDDDVAIAPALAELVPALAWLPHLSVESDLAPVAFATRAALGPRWTAALLAAAADVDRDLITVLGELAQTPAALPARAALLDHGDPEVRWRAAHLALRGPDLDARLSAATERELRRLVAAYADEYDVQLAVEALIAGIARHREQAGLLWPVLADIACSDVPAFRAAAARALGALGNAAALPTLEDLDRRVGLGVAHAVELVRAALRFARWQLTGDETLLAAAVADVGDRTPFEFIVTSDFVPTERELVALARIARGAGWQRIVLEHAARIGPGARPAVELASPGPDDAVALQVARWRTGIDDATTTAGALGAMLASDHTAWSPYVATSVGTPSWRATIEDGLRGPRPETVRSALSTCPSVALGFVPALVATGADELVHALWRDHREVFWRAAGG